jgi:hypothetical protein
MVVAVRVAQVRVDRMEQTVLVVAVAAAVAR